MNKLPAEEEIAPPAREALLSIKLQKLISEATRTAPPFLAALFLKVPSWKLTHYLFQQKLLHHPYWEALLSVNLQKLIVKSVENTSTAPPFTAVLELNLESRITVKCKLHHHHYWRSRSFGCAHYQLQHTMLCQCQCYSTKINCHSYCTSDPECASF